MLLPENLKTSKITRTCRRASATSSCLLVRVCHMLPVVDVIWDMLPETGE